MISQIVCCPIFSIQYKSVISLEGFNEIIMQKACQTPGLCHIHLFHFWLDLCKVCQFIGKVFSTFPFHSWAERAVPVTMVASQLKNETETLAETPICGCQHHELFFSFFFPQWIQHLCVNTFGRDFGWEKKWSPCTPLLPNLSGYTALYRQFNKTASLEAPWAHDEELQSHSSAQEKRSQAV